MSIEKLVAFVEQTICCGDACLCPGGDCFQSMERGKAVAASAAAYHRLVNASPPM